MACSGDPINLAFLGSEADMHQAMAAAGWTRADDLDFRAGLRIVTSTLRRQSYPQAPVSPLHLFERQQDFAYQQEVAGSPSKRHHVRFWRCPDDWMLPGGYVVDWLAAGTYDRSVGLSLFTLQITHKIEADTDVERDFIVTTVVDADPSVEVEIIKNFSTGYHSRNGGGDLIETDGHLPIVDVRIGRPPEFPAEVTQSDSRDRRPAPTMFGSAVTFIRGLVYLGVRGVVDPLLARGVREVRQGSGYCCDGCRGRHRRIHHRRCAHRCGDHRLRARGCGPGRAKLGKADSDGCVRVQHDACHGCQSPRHRRDHAGSPADVGFSILVLLALSSPSGPRLRLPATPKRCGDAAGLR